MLAPDIYRTFVERLNALGLRYCITGSTAGIAYGEPRMTNDIDIVVELPLRQISKFAAAFPIAEFYCPPEDVLVVEVRREQRGHCNIIEHESGFKADIYFPCDELHAWALTERKQLSLDGLKMYLAPPEYVIVRKLEYYREGNSEKHIRDIRGMLHVSAATIRLKIVEEWVRKFGLASQWDRARMLDPHQ